MNNIKHFLIIVAITSLLVMSEASLPINRTETAMIITTKKQSQNQRKRIKMRLRRAIVKGPYFAAGK